MSFTLKEKVGASADCEPFPARQKTGLGREALAPADPTLASCVPAPARRRRAFGSAQAAVVILSSQMNGHEQVQQAYLERIPTLNFNADGRLENVNEGGAFLVFGGRRQYDKMMTSSTSDIEARTLIRPGASSLSELQEVSSSDLLARLAASTLRREWGDAIVVELCICDAAGAFTTVKVEVDVLEQPSTAARGYTLLILRPATMSTSAQTPSNDFVNSPDLAPKPTARMNGLTDTWREQPPSLSEVYRTLSVVTARVTSTGVPRTDSPLPTSEDEMDTSSSTSTSTSAIPAPAWTPPLQELKDLLDHVPTICFTASAAGQVEWLNQGQSTGRCFSILRL